MKKIICLLFFLFLSTVYGQTEANPIIVIDAQKIGFMNDLKKEMEELNPNDISTITVYKDSLISKKYGSEKGVIIITTKKFILDTFYKNFIEKTSLKEKINSPESLATIGIFGGNPKSKNQPFDELQKYIDTNTINEKIEKIAKITYLNPEDSVQLNPEWINGAIEIDSIIE